MFTVIGIVVMEIIGIVHLLSASVLFAEKSFFLLVLFKIEVIGFVDLSEVAAYEKCSRAEKENKTLDEVLAVTNIVREVSWYLY